LLTFLERAIGKVRDQEHGVERAEPPPGGCNSWKRQAAIWDVFVASGAWKSSGGYGATIYILAALYPKDRRHN
jgi:hypothetical protein